MNYCYLGKLPTESIEFFKKELLKQVKDGEGYQWLDFNTTLEEYFDSIFENTDLEIQTVDGRRVQKAFYSEPGHGYRIHKDGIRCMSALNIAVLCNPTDWVRWYDENLINVVGSINVLDKPGMTSRDVSIYKYEPVPYIEQRHNEIGDVYLVNTDAYHSFKCVGSVPRIVIQTKFSGFPSIDTIYNSLKEKSFKNLIR